MNLPQCEITCLPPMSGRETLIISGGRFPSVDWLKEVAVDREIICVDRGVEICLDAGILPELVIGDFDSVDHTALFLMSDKKIPVEKHPVDKDYTDIQLAINRADQTRTMIITGAFGGRFDHAFSTVFSCAFAAPRIVLADDKEIMFYLRDNESVNVKFIWKPFALSLLPMSDNCEGVTINNVRWELDNAVLAQSLPNAVSNRVEADSITISIKRGTLAVYFCFGELL